MAKHKSQNSNTKSDKELTVGKLKKLVDGHVLQAALGTSILYFNCLEFDLIIAIENLMPDVNVEYTHRLLGGDNFKTLVSKFNRIFLFRIKDKILIKELFSLSKELHSINEQRNQAFHSFWAYGEEDTLYRYKFNTRAKVGNLLFQANSKTTINEIHNFNKRLSSAITDVRRLKEKAVLFLINKPE